MLRDVRHGLLGGLCIVLVLVTLSGCGQRDAAQPISSSPPSAHADSGEPRPLTIGYPFEGTVFPPDFIPPEFRWQDSASPARRWQLTLAFTDDAAPLEFVSESPHWTPGAADWETIKRRSQETTCTVTITGVRAVGEAPVSLGTISFTTSTDPVVRRSSTAR